MQLSIIIPAYNEEHRLPATLAAIERYIATKSLDAEVIVVSDGSTDKTDEVVLKLNNPRIQLLSYRKNRGKGFALRYGVLCSKGQWVLIDDADGSTPIEEYERLSEKSKEGFEVVIGSRALGSKETQVRTVWYRKFIGRSFAALVNVLIVPGIADTQCGFKLFSRQAGEELFFRQRSERFSFDVELLFLARKFGFRIAEVAVNWTNAPGSKVNLVRDSIEMFLDIIRFRFLGLMGIYRDKVPESQIRPLEN